MNNELTALFDFDSFFAWYTQFKQTFWKATITKKLDQITWLEWSLVRNVCILEDYGVYDNILRPNSCYISREKSWLLVIDKTPDIEYILNKCGSNITRLHIEIVNCHKTIDLSLMTKLKVLYLKDIHASTGISSVVNGFSQLHSLQKLYMRGPFVIRKLDLSNSRKLKMLLIYDNNNLCNLTGLTSLLELRSLSLSHLPNVCSVDVTNLSSLQHIEISAMAELREILGLFSLNSLETMHIFSSELDSPVNVSGLTSLKALTLSNMPQVKQIIGLDTLKNLEHLDISGTSITQIPDAVRSMSLRTLNLSRMNLEALPGWLTELNLEFVMHHRPASGIGLSDTKVKNVDMSIFFQNQEIILQWFAVREQAYAKMLNEVKVVFLGDGEAGKTHTIARLLNDGDEPKPEDFDDKATPGIVIKDKPYDLDGTTIKVHFWDFGGQEILHSMHRMFLTERTLYVVLLNARDDTQDDRARYWLHNIRSFAGESPVLLVLNKIDQNPNASVNERKLRELYGGLRRVVSLSALEYSPEQFNTALTNALKEEIKALDTVGTLWPASWAKLKTGLETMKSNFITGTEYKKMCRDSGVDKNEKELLRWFNDLGVSFCYQGSRRLEHYVILRPEWITNGIYILLFNKSEETKNGLIPKRVIYEMLDPEDESIYRRVLGGVTYDVNETEYVLEVMRKFRLSYAVSNDEEFIPALCQRDSMPIAKEYADDPDALEFRMTYDYLPDNVIHRLMVEMRQDLQLSDVWRTGALFRQQGTGLSAVVESEGDVLRIFVRSTNPMHRPNTYLCILKENIDRINRDMKLKEPLAEVVYKTSDGKDQFDYEELLNALEDGEETYRSKTLRRRIPIWDILNQTGRGVELELEKLRDDILTACMQMQTNRSFWTANDEARIEDERNTYLRDTLINRGYLVNDQHLQGQGSGNRGYGELDLDIRQEAAIPWTILEALRIKDGSKSDWNRHLKKLLDNYNPSGLNHLFLLTYVDSSKDDFEEIMRKFSEHIKWHDELPYVRLPSTFSHVSLRRHGDPAYLQVMRCTYDRNGAPTTVTHIFVRMGE